jgi:hypothetical protein
MKGMISMKIRIRNRLAVLVAGLLMLSLARTGWAGESVSFDKRLPKSVVGYASIRNVKEFKAQWSKTLFGQMIADESLADFRGEVMKFLAANFQEATDQLGMSASDVLEIPEGEVAFGVVANADGQLQAVLLVDFGEHGEAVHKLLDKARESAEKDGAKFTEEEVDDTKIVSHKSAGEDNDKSKVDGAYFIKDTVIVLGDDVPTLKDVLTRWDGKHDNTLSENDSYQYIVDKCRDEGQTAPPQLTWFIDPVALVQAIIAAHPEAAGPAAGAVGLFPTLGVDRFKGVGGVLEMEQGEFDSVSRTLIMLERAPQGIGNLFQFDATAQAPPKWLSADWTSYTVINWNVAKAYSTVESFADMFLGPGTLAAQIQQLAENPATGNLHAKKDILDQLTGSFHMASLEGKPDSKSAQGTLLAVQIKKAAAVRATLAKIAGLGIVKMQERDFLGETLYEIDAPTPAGEGEEAEPTKLGLAVSEGHLLFASDVRLLERVLRGVGDAETLADSAAYKRIARRFPSKTASISFSRQDSQMKSLFDMLRTAPTGLVNGLEGLDFSKLPDADVLKKYLPPTGSYMEQDAKGLKITSFSLRNESE